MSPDTPKAVVRRFNAEVIQNLDRAAFDELMSPDFVNHSAPPGTPAGPESMWNTFEKVLHPALSELKVEMLDQVCEDDKVTSRKRISGVHTGPLFGVPATHAAMTIDVIDIVRVEDGRYVEHWGINTLPAILAGLRAR